jgi:gliding motility-associated-like protein
MKRFAVLSIISLTLSVSAVSARTEYRLGEDGNPWVAALSDGNAGVYLVVDAQGQVERRIQVGTTPFGAGTDTMIHFTATSIQPRFIEKEKNLTLTDPNAPKGGVPLPYTGGRVNPATSCIHQSGDIKNMKPMFDGDPSSTAFNFVSRLGAGWRGTSVIDLGAALPINRIRFYPRLGQKDDLRLIQSFTEPVHPIEVFSPDSFAENTLGGYEIRVADNSANIFIKGPCDRLPSGNHSVNVNWVTPGDERLSILKNEQENLDVVVELNFPTRSVRWLTFQPFPEASWEVAEFEVYGGGFVRESVLITQILDFGKPVNWGKIRWSGDFPAGTHIEVHTRTGNTTDPNLYFNKDANGNTVSTTKEEWGKINFLVQLPSVYDTANWTFWSPPYDFEAGRSDPSLPAEEWKDGTPIISEGVGRYIQLTIRLFGTFEEAPRLDQIAIQFGENPVAREVVAEIWPIEVASFEPTLFTYVVKPTFEVDDTGFDHLEILTHTRVDHIQSIKVDGVEVDTTRFRPDIQDDRLVVALPLLVGEDNSLKQVEVVFEALVLRFGTPFTSWVFNSKDQEQIKQRIQPGNATFRFSGDVLSVISPIGGDLLIDVVATSRIFTPNGDRINDDLILSYKLREVTAARQVALEIYDLGGRLVQKLSSAPSTSGEGQHRWDGRTSAGELVPPGTYLYQLVLDAEEKEKQTGVFAVAY